MKGNIKTLESQVQNGYQKTNTIGKSLETFAGQKIQDLRGTKIKRFGMIEEIMELMNQVRRHKGRTQCNTQVSELVYPGF